MSSSRLKVYSKKLPSSLPWKVTLSPLCFLRVRHTFACGHNALWATLGCGHTGDVHRQWDTYRALSWPSSGSGHLRRRWSLKWLWQCLPWLPDAQRKTERCDQEAPSCQHGGNSHNKCLLSTHQGPDTCPGAGTQQWLGEMRLLFPCGWCSSAARGRQ